MKHLFAPYELALKAKEAGFDELCLKYYYKEELRDANASSLISQEEVGNIYGGILAPLYQQLIDWFREKHNLSVELKWDPSYEYDKDEKTKGGAWSDAIWEITLVWIKEKEWDAESPDFQRGDGKQLTYYSAMNVAIEKAFELIKK